MEEKVTRLWMMTHLSGMRDLGLPYLISLLPVRKKFLRPVHIKVYKSVWVLLSNSVLSLLNLDYYWSSFQDVRLVF